MTLALGVLRRERNFGVAQRFPNPTLADLIKNVASRQQGTWSSKASSNANVPVDHPPPPCVLCTYCTMYVVAPYSNRCTYP